MLAQDLDNSHSKSFGHPGSDVFDLQDALDLIEFVSGPADSEWGSMRNKMGRSKPWDLNYFAIGNEVSAAAAAPASA